MRALTLTIVGAIGGILAGLLLSELIGIAGFLISGDAVGIKHLPIFLGVALAVALPLLDARRRRRSDRSS